MREAKSHRLHKIKYNGAELREYDKEMFFLPSHLLKDHLCAVGKRIHRRLAPLMKAGKAYGAYPNPLVSA